MLTNYFSSIPNTPEILIQAFLIGSLLGTASAGIYLLRRSRRVVISEGIKIPRSLFVAIRINKVLIIIGLAWFLIYAITIFYLTGTVMSTQFLLFVGTGAVTCGVINLFIFLTLKMSQKQRR